MSESDVVSRPDDHDGLGSADRSEKLARIAALLGCRPEALRSGGELSGRVGEAAHLLKLFLDIESPENRRALLDLATKLAAA